MKKKIKHPMKIFTDVYHKDSYFAPTSTCIFLRESLDVTGCNLSENSFCSLFHRPFFLLETCIHNNNNIFLQEKY